MSEEKKEKSKQKNIEIVTGNGKDLDISPVYDHVIIDKPISSEKKKNVIIPKENNNNKK